MKKPQSCKGCNKEAQLNPEGYCRKCIKAQKNYRRLKAVLCLNGRDISSIR